MARFDVRRATSEDATDVRRVARESWHAAYDDIVGAEVTETIVDEWYDLEGLRASIAREDGRFLVAETEGEVVGFAQAVLGEETAELPRIYVHPDHWGRGLGTQLLDRIERWLRERGVERLRLVVLSDNEVGNDFYERSGYEVVAERDAQLLDVPVEEYVREKEL